MLLHVRDRGALDVSRGLCVWEDGLKSRARSASRSSSRVRR